MHDFADKEVKSNLGMLIKITALWDGLLLLIFRKYITLYQHNNNIVKHFTQRHLALRYPLNRSAIVENRYCL